MFRSTLFLALAASLAAGSALANPARSPAVAETLAMAQRAELARARGDVGPTAAPTAEEVGDARSFGRNVKWLGLLTGNAFLSTDCTPPAGEPANPGCVQLDPAPATTNFTVADVAAVTLPARSANSFICQTQTPVSGASFINQGASREQSIFRLYATYRIESEVLQGLSDPNTGDPYNGAIEVGIGNVYESGYLEPGDYAFRQYTQTRACIGGLVSKNNLVNGYGLTEAQANQFFRRPITIRMSLHGTARMVESASLYVGTRLTGD